MCVPRSMHTNVHVGEVYEIWVSHFGPGPIDRLFFFGSMTESVATKTPATALAGAWESCNEIRLQARSQQAATKLASYVWVSFTDLQ